MSETAHDHELEVLEDDQNVPPRPEEQIADAPGPPRRRRPAATRTLPRTPEADPGSQWGLTIRAAVPSGGRGRGDRHTVTGCER